MTEAKKITIRTAFTGTFEARRTLNKHIERSVIADYLDTAGHWMEEAQTRGHLDKWRYPYVWTDGEGVEHPIAGGHPGGEDLAEHAGLYATHVLDIIDPALDYTVNCEPWVRDWNTCAEPIRRRMIERAGGDERAARIAFDHASEAWWDATLGTLRRWMAKEQVGIYWNRNAPELNSATHSLLSRFGFIAQTFYVYGDISIERWRAERIEQVSGLRALNLTVRPIICLHRTSTGQKPDPMLSQQEFGAVLELAAELASDGVVYLWDFADEVLERGKEWSESVARMFTEPIFRSDEWRAADVVATGEDAGGEGGEGVRG